MKYHKLSRYKIKRIILCFLGRDNSEFCEQNLVDKSGRGKCMLQRDSRGDFATFFEGAGEGIGRI